MIDLSSPIATGRTAEVFDWPEKEDGLDLVLKLYRDWAQPSWVEFELKMARVVCQAGIPAPRVFGDLVEIGGRHGILYEKLEGRSMLDEMKSHPAQLPQYAQTLGRLHAEMHAQPAADLPDKHLQTGWDLNHAEPLPEALRPKVLALLESLPRGDRLCHGDYHPHNVLMTPKGPAIIDWMTANCGSPSADVARTLLLLTNGDVEGMPLVRLLLLFGRRVLVQNYLKGYRAAAKAPLERLDDWRVVLAAARLNEHIPSEEKKLLEIVRRGVGG